MVLLSSPVPPGWYVLLIFSPLLFAAWALWRSVMHSKARIIWATIGGAILVSFFWWLGAGRETPSFHGRAGAWVSTYETVRQLTMVLVVASGVGGLAAAWARQDAGRVLWLWWTAAALVACTILLGVGTVTAWWVHMAGDPIGWSERDAPRREILSVVALALAIAMSAVAVDGYVRRDGSTPRVRLGLIVIGLVTLATIWKIL
jgi:hypothetical protein